MGNIPQSADMLKPVVRIHPERKAWGILLLAFAIFCVICVSTTLGLNFFFFQSTVPMEALLRVGRGTAGIVTKSDPIEEVVRSDPRVLFTGATISTDAQTQATISFRDSQDAGQLTAAVTIRRNTSLSFGAASRPRFEWSTTNYYVNLYDFQGEIDVFVPDNLPRAFRLDVQTVEGWWVSLSKSGRYIVTASDDQIRVINREGEAVLFVSDLQINRSIPETMQGSYVAGASEISLSPAYVELLRNSSFEELEAPLAGDNPDTVSVLPIGWACTNTQDDLPRGAYRSEFIEGRLAMRLVRDEGASSHGETRCLQAFPGQNGLDVSQYDYLALRATFFVDYQSLSVCGIDGSECPLMLNIDYLDVNGTGRQWYHGFYAKEDPQVNSPTACSSCAQDHERIYEKAWYAYDSGNLFTLFPPDARPGSILVIRFYASGHQYDVYVSEISLLAGQLTNGTESTLNSP